MTAEEALKSLQQQLIESQDFTEIDFSIKDKIKIWVGKTKCVIRCREDLKHHIRKRLLTSLYNSIREQFLDESRNQIIISNYVKI